MIKMLFDEFDKGKLDFKRITTKSKNESSSRPLFLFENEFYICEEFVIEYYKSKGYDAFFSENSTWSKLIKILLKDIFKEFKKIRKEKKYKVGFYDDEFFKLCEDKISDRFSYLKNINIVDLIKNERIKPNLKEKIIKICNSIDHEKILFVLYDWIQDYSRKTNGFPDLFVFNDDEAFFCEVKSAGDFLSAKQVRAHEVLINAGIDVVIFGVNKQEYWILEEKNKYFNEDFYDEFSFKETYDYKIKIANRVYKELENENIYDIRTYMFTHYDLNTFLGFLNVLNDYKHEHQIKILKNIDDTILIKSKHEGEKIKNLKYLSEGYYFEERGYYQQAVDKYKHVNNYYGCNKLCICYRKLKEFEKEINLTYEVINNVDFIEEDCKVNFKKRARRFIKNPKNISVYKTGNKCPICGDEEVIVELHKRGDVKIRICMNGSCYWYGGIYTGNVNGFSYTDDLKNMQVDNDLKNSKFKQMRYDKIKKNKLKYSLELKKEQMYQFKNNKSYLENVEIKRELINKGETLVKEKNHDGAIEFFNDLISNELFVNDYYPHLMLTKAYHEANDFENETNTIINFLKSGISCRKSNLTFFINQLKKLNYHKVNELKEYYNSHGAKNRKLSNVPVPLATNLKKGSKINKKPLKYPLDYFKNEFIFNHDLSYDEKIKFKKNLIMQGELLIKNKDYDKAIVYFKGLVNHELFINDCYPYERLSDAYKKDKRRLEEVDLLINFFKSGIYCDKKQLRKFKRRLKQLNKYGFYDYAEIEELEYEFLQKGALNKSLSDNPILSAAKIMNSN